jgi:Glutamyl- and glutaminyl-tRNA synthetases
VLEDRVILTLVARQFAGSCKMVVVKKEIWSRSSSVSLDLDILLCFNVFDTIRYGDVAGRAVLSKLNVIRAADYVNMIYEYLNPLQPRFMHISRSTFILRYSGSKLPMNLTVRYRVVFVEIANLCCVV